MVSPIFISVDPGARRTCHILWWCHIFYKKCNIIWVSLWFLQILANDWNARQKEQKQILHPVAQSLSCPTNFAKNGKNWTPMQIFPQNHSGFRKLTHCSCFYQGQMWHKFVCYFVWIGGRWMFMRKSKSGIKKATNIAYIEEVDGNLSIHVVLRIWGKKCPLILTMPVRAFFKTCMSIVISPIRD